MEIGRTGRVQVEDIVFLVRKDPRKYARVKDLLTMNEELKRARKAFDEIKFVGKFIQAELIIDLDINSYYCFLLQARMVLLIIVRSKKNLRCNKSVNIKVSFNITLLA